MGAKDHPECQKCIAKQIEDHGAVYIECSGMANKDYVIPDEIKEKYDDNTLEILFELADPAVWAEKNVEVVIGGEVCQWSPRKSKDGLEFQKNLIQCTARRMIYRLGRRCITGDMNILHSDMLYKTMDDTNIGDIIIGKNVLSGKFEKQKILDKWCTGIRDVYKITFSNGKYIKCTKDHPILVLIGQDNNKHEAWRSIDTMLKKGMYGSGIVNNIIPELKTEYYKIESIEYVGKEKTYDITVDKISSFICNDITLHNCGKCLEEGTLIMTPSGSVEIQNLKPGDIVYGYDIETDTVFETPVAQVHNQGMQEIIDLYNENNEKIYGCTPQHRWGFVDNNKRVIKELHEYENNAKIIKTDVYNNSTYQTVYFDKTKTRKAQTWDITLNTKDSLYLTADGLVTHNTESIAILILYYMLTNDKYRIILITPFSTQIEEIMERVLTYLDSSPQLRHEKKRYIKTPIPFLTLKNGSTLKAYTAGGTGGATIRGGSANMIIVDEGDYLDESTYNTFMPILNDHPDTRFINASTPTGIRARWYKLNHDKTYKVWHYSSRVIPHWNEQMEKEQREQLTNAAFTFEIEASFGESQLLAVENKYIDASLKEYGYGLFNKKVDGAHVYTIGVDWNKYKNGTRIVIVEQNIQNGKVKIVDKVKITSEKWTQTRAVEKIVELNRQWNPSAIYIDSGYGHVQTELLQILSVNAEAEGGHPSDIRLKDILKAIDFSSNIEIKDTMPPYKMKKKNAKGFLVENMVRFYEKDLMSMNLSDDELIKQLQNYGVVGYRKDNGVPIYGPIDENTPDHDVDALMLALAPLTLESNMFKPNIITKVSKTNTSSFLSYDKQEDKTNISAIKYNIDVNKDDVLEPVADFNVNKDIDVENDTFVNMPLDTFVSQMSVAKFKQDTSINSFKRTGGFKKPSGRTF